MGNANVVLGCYCARKEDTAMAYSYSCKDYPGMEACPASFTAETEAELWKHIELHALAAHQEHPEQWAPEDREQIKKLIH
jgi:Protein of unknown function (DUF1059)